MATTTVRSTYSLDVDTVKILEDIAGRWKVSRSEALRRAIRRAADDESTEGPDALDALDALQRAMRLNASSARAWAARTRSQRRASSRRREP